MDENYISLVRQSLDISRTKNISKREVTAAKKPKVAEVIKKASKAKLKTIESTVTPELHLTNSFINKPENAVNSVENHKQSKKGIAKDTKPSSEKELKRKKPMSVADSIPNLKNSTETTQNYFKTKKLEKKVTKKSKTTNKITNTSKITLKKGSIIEISSSEDESSATEGITFEDFTGEYELSLNKPFTKAIKNISASELFHLHTSSSSNSSSENDSVEIIHTNQKGKVKKNALDKNIVEKSCALNFEEELVESSKILTANTDDSSWEVEYFEPEYTKDSWEVEDFECSHLNDATNLNLEDKAQKSFTIFKGSTHGKQYVVLEPGEIVHFYGIIAIKVIHGELEVLGSILTSSSGEQRIYSPRGTALMYLRNCKKHKSNTEVNLNNLGTAKHTSFNENSVVVEFCNYEEPKLDFVVKHTSQQILPENNNVMFDPDGNFAKLKTDIRWDSAIDLLNTNNKKLMVIGGKGVGKSTFLRYTINRLLTRHKRIRLVDLDPGQAEFTVPGCVSVVVVENPVHGPNYTHLQCVYSSVLSNINVATDIKKYITSVAQLYNDLETLEEWPTVINFMGFTQDMGFAILSACIAICQPDYVINIVSKSPHKNYKLPVNLKSVEENCTQFVKLNINNIKDFTTIEVDSLAESNEAWSLEPRQARELCVLAYFGEMMSKNVNSLTSSELNMFCIEMSLVKFTDFDGHSISPLAANANLVALCSAYDDSMNIFKCHGYGIVRSVDLESGILILLTPLDGTELEKVFYLVVASVTLPPSVLMTMDNATGHVPYVSKGELVGLGQFTKRSYLPKK